MKVVKEPILYKNWSDMIFQKKGSRAAVFFTEDIWERVPEGFKVAFTFYYECKYYSAGELGQAEEELPDWKPELMLAAGNVFLLQRSCWFRQQLVRPAGMLADADVQTEQKDGDRRSAGTVRMSEQGREQGIPLVMISGNEDVRLLKKEVLWIRSPEGHTLHIQAGVWGQEDILAVPCRYEETGRKQLLREYERWEDVLLEKGSSGLQRTVWEELAEPMLLRYGIWLWIGIYHAFLFLYQEAGRETREKLDALYRGGRKIGAGEYLAEVAEKNCPDAVDSVWLPKRDVDILTDMAMAGIEMLPGQKLSRQQVKTFYEALSL